MHRQQFHSITMSWSEFHFRFMFFSSLPHCSLRQSSSAFTLPPILFWVLNNIREMILKKYCLMFALALVWEQCRWSVCLNMHLDANSISIFVVIIFDMIYGIESNLNNRQTNVWQTISTFLSDVSSDHQFVSSGLTDGRNVFSIAFETKLIDNIFQLGNTTLGPRLQSFVAVLTLICVTFRQRDQTFNTRIIDSVEYGAMNWCLIKVLSKTFAKNKQKSKITDQIHYQKFNLEYWREKFW